MKVPALALVLLFSLPAVAQDSTQTNLFLHLQTDCWPEETTWKIADTEQNEIASGGPYSGLAQEEINTSFWLVSGSYIFTIYDAAGDGMHGTQWGSQCDEDGNFTLIDAGDNILLDYDGSYNFDSLTVAFEFDETVDVDQPERQTMLKVYPNPFTHQLNIAADNASGEFRIEIFASNGKEIWEETGRIFSSGAAKTINLDFLPKGIYALRITGSDFSHSTQIIKLN